MAMTEEQKARKKQQRIKLQAERKARHECTRCGTKLPEGETKIQCLACREKQQKCSRKHYKDNRQKISERRAKPRKTEKRVEDKNRRIAERLTQLKRDQLEAIRLARGKNEYERRELEELAESRKNRLAQLQKYVIALRR